MYVCSCSGARAGANLSSRRDGKAAGWLSGCAKRKHTPQIDATASPNACIGGHKERAREGVGAFHVPSMAAFMIPICCVGINPSNPATSQQPFPFGLRTKPYTTITATRLPPAEELRVLTPLQKANMASIFTETNVSLYTLPAGWVLCLLPRFYAAYLYTSTTSKPLDLILPRALAARAAADQALDSATRDRIVRAEAAQANGLENVGYFAAAVVAANVAGLSKSSLNALSIGYLVSRGVYNWTYVVGATKKMALVRTAVFLGGQGMLFALFIMAGNRMR